MAAITAGVYHSLALKTDGTVWAWGYNGYGQLDDGTATNHTPPVLVCPYGGYFVQEITRSLAHS